MLRARYIGVGCAFQVLGRSRRAIRRLRRASFSCLLVFTRNVLRVSAAFWCRSRTLLCATDISSVSFTRRAKNALVLGLVHRLISYLCYSRDGDSHVSASALGVVHCDAQP